MGIDDKDSLFIAQVHLPRPWMVVRDYTTDVSAEIVKKAKKLLSVPLSDNYPRYAGGVTNFAPRPHQMENGEMR
jgi:hypothetical protein